MAINRCKSDSTSYVNASRRDSGFTIIELLIVLAIIGMLAIMAMNAFSSFTTKANIVKASEEVRGLEKEIIAFTTDKTTLPSSLEDIGRQDLLDPWKRPYVYSRTLHRRQGQLKNSDFDLYSKGFDGITADSIIDFESLDDIIRVDDGAYCGLALGYGL